MGTNPFFKGNDLAEAFKTFVSSLVHRGVMNNIQVVYSALMRT